MNFDPGLPCWLRHKKSASNVGDLSLITGLGRSPGEGSGNPFQCSFSWRIPWTEEPGYRPWGRKESDITERLALSAQMQDATFGRLLNLPGQFLRCKNRGRTDARVSNCFLSFSIGRGWEQAKPVVSWPMDSPPLHQPEPTNPFINWNPLFHLI